MSVGNKYPNESRHETALRYIKSKETETYLSCKDVTVNTVSAIGGIK